MLIHVGEVVLCSIASLIGSLSVPFGSLGKVPNAVFALLVKDAEAVLGT